MKSLKIICRRCKGKFFVYPSRAKSAKFCSRKCKRFIYEKLCKICGKSFLPAWPGNAKYCSHGCYAIAEKGRTPWNKNIKASEDERIKRFSDAGHRAMTGRPGWNKGLTWGNSGWLRKANPNRYRNIHKKIYKLFGNSSICEGCGKRGNNRQIHWANKNGKYLIKREDWIRLCVKCHIRFDESNKTKKDLIYA